VSYLQALPVKYIMLIAVIILWAATNLRNSI
jgi:hypothetical protein